MNLDCKKNLAGQHEKSYAEVVGTVDIKIRLLEQDAAALAQRARVERRTVAEVVREAIGAQTPPRGGKREGAGRKPGSEAVAEVMSLLRAGD